MNAIRSSRNHLEALGYKIDHIRTYENGRIVFLHRLLFTTAILVMNSPHSLSYDNRWCYASEKAALEAMERWNPDTEPEPTGWHRHPPSGRRRPNGDASQEYINH